MEPNIDQDFKDFVYSKSPKEQARIFENAARANDVETIQKLFVLNANPNIKSGDYEWDALTVACLNNKFKAAKALLKGGASSKCALKGMIVKSKLNGVKFLLKQNADPNAISRWNRENESAIHLAAKCCKRGEIMKLLIDHGANILLPLGWFNETPLVVAIRYRHIENLKVMLPHYKEVHGGVYECRDLRVKNEIKGDKQIMKIFKREGIRVSCSSDEKCVLY